VSKRPRSSRRKEAPTSPPRKDQSLVTSTATMREDAPAYRVDGAPISKSAHAGSDSGAPLRFIDLFCGIGGFRIAFEQAGALRLLQRLGQVQPADLRRELRRDPARRHPYRGRGRHPEIRHSLRWLSLPALQPRGRLQETQPRPQARLRGRETGQPLLHPRRHHRLPPLGGVRAGKRETPRPPRPGPHL